MTKVAVKVARIIAVILGASMVFWLDDDLDLADVNGKRVLVTGGSRGIGEQLAYIYCRHGANVVVTARGSTALQTVTQRCRKLGTGSKHYGYIAADMNNLNSTFSVIQEAVNQLGGLDVIVLNHILPHNLAPWLGTKDNLTLASDILTVNFRSYVYLASAALPWLRESHGRIIVMSSLSGKVGTPYTATYVATKFALNGFFSALRNEFIHEQFPYPSITLCTIGLIGTQSALDHLRRFGSRVLTIMTPSDPERAALEVAKAGNRRQHEVFFPYLSTKTICLLRDFFPDLINILLRYVNGRPTLNDQPKDKK